MGIPHIFCGSVFQNISRRLEGWVMVVMVVRALEKVVEKVVVVVGLSHLALEESIVLEKHRCDLESPVLWGDVIEVFGILLFHIITASTLEYFYSLQIIHLCKNHRQTTTMISFWKELIIVVWVIALRELRAVFTSNYLQMLPPASNP